MVRGWRAAAARAGLTPSMARRLVARGELRATRAGAAYEFTATDLDALRTRLGERAEAASIAGLGAPSPSGRSDDGPLEPSSGDGEVRELIAAAARERALTAKYTAEAERLRAEVVRDQLVREHQEADRARRITKVVEQALRQAPEPAPAHVGPLLAQRLQEVDLDQRLTVAGVVMRTLAEAHNAAEARRAASARGQAAVVPPGAQPPSWRASQVDSVTGLLWCELQDAGCPSGQAEYAVRAAAAQLALLDDGSLADARWAVHVARSTADQVLASALAGAGP